MIDLTPLDVRNKRGDFKKLMRGYDPQEVDVFLEIVAERLEMLTRENIALKALRLGWSLPIRGSSKDRVLSSARAMQSPRARF